MGDEETELEATIKSIEEAKPGDDVCWIIKGLIKQNTPCSGDVMVYKKDEFDAQISRGRRKKVPGKIKSHGWPMKVVEE